MSSQTSTPFERGVGHTRSRHLRTVRHVFRHWQEWLTTLLSRAARSPHSQTPEFIALAHKTGIESVPSRSRRVEHATHPGCQQFVSFRFMSHARLGRTQVFGANPKKFKSYDQWHKGIRKNKYKMLE